MLLLVLCSCFLWIWLLDDGFLDVVIVGLDMGIGMVDVIGSLGIEVWVVIKCNGVFIEIILVEINIGNNQILFISILQNGDVVCVQAFNNGFLVFDEDCCIIFILCFGFVLVN